MCQCLQKALSLEIFSGLGKLWPNETGKSMPVVIFFLHFGSHTISMQALLLIFGLLTLNVGHAGSFSGGHDALVSAATEWIAADQSLDKSQVEVIPPDQRVPVESCQTRIAIRFPFSNNLKTVEVACKNPAWKRYLRVKIQEQQNVWVFAENLTEGTRIKEEHLAYMPKASSAATESLNKDQIIGRVIRQNVSEGDGDPLQKAKDGLGDRISEDDVTNAKSALKTSVIFIFETLEPTVVSFKSLKLLISF